MPPLPLAVSHRIPVPQSAVTIGAPGGSLHAPTAEV
jgi:hypothetical protein